MTRDHFSKVMRNPYFQTEHYKNESNATFHERKIESFLKKILGKFKKSK